ncbi:uncharacterized protein MEPE_00421 [Melanopsichium pennsylvanicum]|uniref:Uncharacterized protein n=2 Tax=Melanopsichium pennsylvanicum TaxID=63383 RepID=A0AAJ4XHA4_9BASI|nr:uncharacterized protein MEPE_00421 [Melanopsichium pennsylvanicum]
MRQKRLDEKRSKESCKKNDISDEKEEEQPNIGTKRKETASAADEEKPKGEGCDDRAKSRKMERSEDDRDEQVETNDQEVENRKTEPAKLSGHQRKIDCIVAGNDVEVNMDANSAEKKPRSSKEIPWHVSEKGHIYFFYRPKVRSADKAESNNTESLDDVQNAFMLLVPRASESETAPASEANGKNGAAKVGQEDKRKPPNPTAYRLISLGKKRMPSPEAALKSGQEPGGIGGRHSEAIWATIADVDQDLKKVADGIGEGHYSTKTRGDRIKPAARPAGRGHYALSIKQTNPPSSREARLTYHLSHPSRQDFGQVQEELGLHPSSSVLMQMRNPTLAPTGPEAPPAGLAEDKRAILTKEELQENFGGDVNKKGNRYARPEKPELLDRQGVELLLIKRGQQEDDSLKGLGNEQSEALAKLAKQDSDRLSDDQVLEELKLSSKGIEVEALSGKWI